MNVISLHSDHRYISAMIFNCGFILTHHNFIYILVLITLKMTTRVAETCCDYYVIKLRS